MTYLEQQGTNYRNSTYHSIAYLSIPMNLPDRNNIRSDIESLFNSNGWRVDYWLSGTSYDDKAIKGADAIVFAIPNVTGSNRLGFKHYLNTLTRGINSEINKSASKDNIFIAYYDVSKKLGIYEAAIHGIHGDSRIEGVAGTRNVLFQKKSEREQDEREKELNRISDREEYIREAVNLRNQYPLTFKESSETPSPSESRLSYLRMVETRGKRADRLIPYGSFMIDRDDLPKMGKLENMMNEILYSTGRVPIIGSVPHNDKTNPLLLTLKH